MEEEFNDEPKESGELFNENEREEDYSNDDDIGDSASVTASSIVDAAISDDINLVLSANDGDVETVTQLLNSGVSIESIDEDGSTPLIAASFGSNSSPQTITIIKLLLDRGANVSAVQEKHGWTPIIAASYVGAVQTLELLLTYKRKPSIQMIKHRDKLGKDAMQYVCDNMLEVSRMLQDGFNYQSGYVAFLEAKEEAIKLNVPFLEETFSIPLPEPGEENLADTLDRHLSCKALLNQALDQTAVATGKNSNIGRKLPLDGSSEHEQQRKRAEPDNERNDDDTLGDSKNEADLLSSSSVTTVLGSSLARPFSSSSLSSAIKARASLGRRSIIMGNNSTGRPLSRSTLVTPPQKQDTHLSATSSSLSTKQARVATSHLRTIRVLDESLARSWALVPLFYLLFLTYKLLC